MTKIDNAIKEIEDFLQFNNVKEISFPEVTRIMANHKIPIEKEEMEKITDILEKKGIYIDSVEEEDIDYGIKPFDYSKINMDMKPLTLKSLYDRIVNNEIDLQPSYQRNLVWDDTKKSRLIESIFLNIPLPAFYVDATDSEKWVVIDGLQRINTIKSFFVDKTLHLKNLEFLDYNGMSCDDVPQSYIRRSMERILTIIQIMPGTPEETKYNIFKRINTGGVSLNSQEIRNALASERTREYLERLSNSNAFLEATYKSISKSRMLDKELVLRFFGFKKFGIDYYSSCNSYDDFMNKTNILIDKVSDDELVQIECDFYKSLETIKEIFGKLAFRKINLDNLKRINPINKGLFDTFSVLISNLSNSERKKLIDNREIFIKILGENLNKANRESKLLTYISSASIASVKGRFDIVERIIQEVLIYD